MLEAGFTVPRAGLGYGELSAAAARGAFDEALTRFGFGALPAEAGCLRVTAGSELSLDRSSALPLARRALHTADVDELKSWVGVADEVAVAAAADELPALPWRGGALARRQLSPAQGLDVQKAARLYLFGDSRPVASYREVIERSFGPFEADLWLARRIVIEAGAALVVRQRPAALLVEELELHAGGKIYLNHVAALTIGSLRRLDLRH